MKSIFKKTRLDSSARGRPPVAIEVSSDGVMGAALSGSDDESVYAFAPLPQGAIVPGIAEQNIRSAEIVASAIRSALGKVSPRSRTVTLILPDPAVRVFVMEFDALPAKAAEAVPVLKLRLRKMVSFDVEHAAVSYQILTRESAGCNVLAAVLPGPILAEYESAVRAAGYEPGVVLPSSLAALETIDSIEAALIASLSPMALTTTIANGSDLLLHRTLDLPEEPSLRLAEIQRGIAVAVAYFEDKLQAPPTKILYSGSYDTAEFAHWIAGMNLHVSDLAPRPQTGVATSLGHASIAGVAGALMGAS